MTHGYVSGKPMIGVSLEDAYGSGGLSYFFGLGGNSGAKEGVYVRELVEGMNDDVLKEGDRIIAVNGEEISSSDDIKALVYASSVGDKLTFQLYRDNKLIEVEVTVYERTPEISEKTADRTDKPEKQEKPENPDRKDGSDGYDGYDGYDDFGDLFDYFGGDSELPDDFGDLFGGFDLNDLFDMFGGR